MMFSFFFLHTPTNIEYIHVQSPKVFSRNFMTVSSSAKILTKCIWGKQFRDISVVFGSWYETVKCFSALATGVQMTFNKQIQLKRVYCWELFFFNGIKLSECYIFERFNSEQINKHIWDISGTDNLCTLLYPDRGLTSNIYCNEISGNLIFQDQSLNLFNEFTFPELLKTNLQYFYIHCSGTKY